MSLWFGAIHRGRRATDRRSLSLSRLSALVRRGTCNGCDVSGCHVSNKRCCEKVQTAITQWQGSDRSDQSFLPIMRKLSVWLQYRVAGISYDLSWHVRQFLGIRANGHHLFLQPKTMGCDGWKYWNIPDSTLLQSPQVIMEITLNKIWKMNKNNEWLFFAQTQAFIVAK